VLKPSAGWIGSEFTIIVAILLATGSGTWSAL